MHDVRSWMVLIPLLLTGGCGNATSTSSTSISPSGADVLATEEPGAPAPAPDLSDPPDPSDPQAPPGDPVIADQMSAALQPRDTPVINPPETATADDEDTDAHAPDAPSAPETIPRYQGHQIAVSIDGAPTTRGRIGKYGRIWRGGDISPTPVVRVEVLDPALGDVASVEITIHRVVAGIVSKPDFYVDERITRQIQPNEDFTLGEFEHFLPNGTHEEVNALPPGAYRFVLLVLTRRADGTTSWDRQLIDAVVPDPE